MDDQPESPFVPDVVPEDDRQFVDETVRLGNRVGWGEMPAILVVDMTEAFLGDRATEPDPVPHTASLLATARETSTPIYYTVPGESAGFPNGYPVAIKASPESARGPDIDLTAERRKWLEGIDVIPSAIEPRDDEVVIEKPRASAFFDTHLGNALRYDGVDTLVVAGLTTSGCVRATAVAAHSSNFRTIVASDCVADSVAISHDISLFDLDHRYADVTPVAEIEDRLRAGV